MQVQDHPGHLEVFFVQRCLGGRTAQESGDNVLAEGRGSRHDGKTIALIINASKTPNNIHCSQMHHDRGGGMVALNTTHMHTYTRVRFCFRLHCGDQFDQKSYIVGTNCSVWGPKPSSHKDKSLWGVRD